MGSAELALRGLPDTHSKHSGAGRSKGKGGKGIPHRHRPEGGRGCASLSATGALRPSERERERGHTMTKVSVPEDPHQPGMSASPGQSCRAAGGENGAKGREKQTNAQRQRIASRGTTGRGNEQGVGLSDRPHRQRPLSPPAHATRRRGPLFSRARTGTPGTPGTPDPPLLASSGGASR